MRALQIYERDGTRALGAQLDDATLPSPLRDAVFKKQSGTYISGGEDPRVWAATGVGEAPGGRLRCGRCRCRRRIRTTIRRSWRWTGRC